MIIYNLPEFYIMTIIQSISLHSVIVKSMAELYQFREGLETLNIATAMTHHSELLYDFFVYKPVALIAGDYYFMCNQRSCN